MKKLMIAACLLVTGAVMGATPTAQVYDVVLKVKTTAAASAFLDSRKNPLAVEPGDEGRDVIYRKQTTATWKGIIWGCGCETINGKWERVHTECAEEPVELDTVKGCVLWDVKTKVPVYIGCFSDLADASTVPGTGFGWNFIHAINKDGKQVEGSWVMEQQGNACDESGVLFSFAGSGFGTANLILEDGAPTCISYVKAIGGNFSGWMKAPTYTNQEGWSGCAACGVPIPASCDFGEAWDWCNWSYVCDCDSGTSEWMDYTAAYGTWQIKHNAGLSKKFAGVVKPAGEPVSICDAYDFGNLPYVENAIRAAEMKVRGETTECEDLAAEIENAKANVKKAEAHLESVSTENLVKAVKEAEANLYAATTNAEAKAAAYDEASLELAVETNYRDSYSNSLYTAAWFFNYVNASGMLVSATGYGIDTLDAKVEELKYFTFDSISFGWEYVIPCTYSGARAFIDGKLALLDGMNKNVATLTGKRDVAEEAMDVAAAEKSVRAEAYDLAKFNLADRDSLQRRAESDLTVANVALMAVQKAYYDAGCN